MTNPEDNDTQKLMQRLNQEFGERTERAPEPVYGQERALPPQPPQPGQPQTIQLSLPMYQPRAFLVLLIINVAIFAIPYVLDLAGVRVNVSGLSVSLSNLVQYLGAKDNTAIAEQHQYYRFLTAMFLHANVLHILFNGWALYAIGPQAERIFGTLRFLAVYFVAGFAGGVASYALSPAPSVGASGAIFGMIGALFSFYYISRTVLGPMARQQLGNLITVIMINLFIGFSGGNIDNFAHLGGLFGGALVGWLLAPRFAVDDRLYPPVVVRNYWSLGWFGTLGVVVLLVLAVMVINPPIS